MWFEIFIEHYTNSLENILDTVYEADSLFPNTGRELRVRCIQIVSKHYDRQENVALGSLENISDKVIEYSSRIPMHIVKAVALEESRLRMEDKYYKEYFVTPPETVEDAILKEAIEHVIGKIPASTDLLLYRIALRLHVNSMKNDSIFLKNDLTIKSNIRPGMSIYGLCVMDERGQIIQLGGERKYYRYLLCSAS